MTKPTFDSNVTASANLNDFGLGLSVITGGSYVHQTKSGTREKIMVLTIGRTSYQTADPNWFRHLIDQANTALQAAGYPPHITPANDADTTTTDERGVA